MPRGVSPEELGLEEGILARVERDGRGYKATDPEGNDLSDQIETYAMKNAFKSKKALKLHATKSGGSQWRQVPSEEWDAMANISTGDSGLATEIHTGSISSVPDNVVRDMVKNAMEYKPSKLQIDPVWWKFAMRAVLRGGNILTVGPSGCGKTFLARCVAAALGRSDKFFYVNLGATQDPRSTLIGNTHFDPDQGTYVALSYFVQAIQTENAVILLDEASRAHPEAHNILMTVLDQTQRYLRVDEKADSETIKVAQGVSFILTANVGSEYTATRSMDRALLDRCMLLEMRPMNKKSELENLKNTYPKVPSYILDSIASVADETRQDVKRDDPKLDTIISTRMAEQWASLVEDGFTFMEAAEVCVFPFFSDAGGADSPRSHVKKVIQRFQPVEPSKESEVNKSEEVEVDGEEPVTPWGTQRR